MNDVNIIGLDLAKHEQKLNGWDLDGRACEEAVNVKGK
jgi:hypothetical protein